MVNTHPFSQRLSFGPKGCFSHKNLVLNGVGDVFVSEEFGTPSKRSRKRGYRGALFLGPKNVVIPKGWGQKRFAPKMVSFEKLNRGKPFFA